MMKISEENVCTGSSYTAEALNVKSGVIVIGVSTINVFTKEHEEKIEVPLTAGTSWEGTWEKPMPMSQQQIQYKTFF